MSTLLDPTEALNKTKLAVEQGKLTESALKNIESWLTEDRYREYLEPLIEHIQGEKWQQLDDAYWTIIPFGTGGRRGKMYPIGSNAINDRTIGESAQGLADYVLDTVSEKESLSCAIAYDTRHKSRHFAELCASIMVANGFKVFFLDEYRATPHLSFAVRHLGCDCGIMVTASHNPPAYNAVKVYWGNGAQVQPPHDAKIIDRVMNVQAIKQANFADSLSEGKIEIVTAKIDQAFLEAASKYAWPGPREVSILFTPLHGVGGFAVPPLLEKCGFKSIEVYQPHAEPSGDFPNVPGNVSNPENAIVFDEPIQYAKANGIDVILATDPDADRLGVAAPLTTDSTGEWGTINGNQIGAMLADFVLRKMKEAGTLTNQHYVIKTLVTTELTRLIAEGYGARCEGNIHVGFKWIAGLMDQVGPEFFAFGTEESHGYLIGTYARDKDGAVACLLMSQLAAEQKALGVSLHQYLDSLFLQHGCHMEDVLNVQMEGSQGMKLMMTLMEALRKSPPTSVGGLDVSAIRDYKALTVTQPNQSAKPLDAPKTDMVVLDLAEPGNYVAVRPSGTEPKVKFYFFSRLSPAESKDLATAKSQLKKRLDAYRDDIQAYAKKVTA